ncbi:MAG: AmmeMemoRadiSam system protein A [Bacillota bacterium]
MNAFAVRAGYLLPHPPIIVPGVGGGRETEAAKTIASMERVAEEIGRLRPDTVVLLSPHAPVFSDYAFMYDAPVLKGDLKQFGTNAEVSFHQDSALRVEIERRMQANGIPGGALDESVMRRNQIKNTLDHGAVVPLYFAGAKYSGFKLVVLSAPALDMQMLYRLGYVIREAAEALGRKIAVVASGDLSHRVNAESPYGACPEGEQFDSFINGSLEANDIPRLLSVDHALREKAGECGYRPLVMLCGAFDGVRAGIQVLSYEAPFGIGYGVAAFRPVAYSGTSAFDEARTMISKGKNESMHVRIARKTLESYVRDGRTPEPKDFLEYGEDAGIFSQPAGVFVSIKKFGELRGCIGTTGPTTDSVAEEIIQNAVSAGTRDPRFPPVTADELEYLDYSVDVLNPPQPVSSKDELDPSVYGVIVENGYRRGLLLPDLEGVDTVERQLEIACKKAGIDPEGEYEISKFTVTRYR